MCSSSLSTTCWVDSNHRDLLQGLISTDTSGRKGVRCLNCHNPWFFHCLKSYRSGIHLFGWSCRTGRGGRCFQSFVTWIPHWASGRLQELKVNLNNPLYCHVQGTMAPSMKAETYSLSASWKRRSFCHHLFGKM